MILGIDPGITGGLASLSGDGLWLEPMPVFGCRVDAKELCRLLRGEQMTCAYIEKPFAMQKAGAASMLNFGINTGIVHGVLATFGIPIVEIRPQEWMKRMFIRCPQNIKGKDRSVWACKKLFPGTSMSAPGKKSFHMGMAEAALIAYYGRELLEG